MSVQRSPTTPTPVTTSSGGGSQPDLSKLSDMAADSLITFRNKGLRDNKRKYQIECECSDEIKDVRSELSRLSSLLEKYVGSNEQIISHIQNSITEVTTQINEIKTSNEQTTTLLRDNIAEIKSQINDVKSSSSNIVKEQNHIKKHVTQLENKLIAGENKIHAIESELKTLKHSSTTSSELPLHSESQLHTNEHIIRELQDRNEREKNVIINGIPESTAPNAEERMQHDEREVQTITNFMNLNIPKPLKIFRIGKYDVGKNRRTKICFETSGTAKLLLRNKEKLQPNIKISSDKTPAQHQFLQSLNEELSRRESNGEIDLTIKYVNGTPTIIKKNPKNYQQ